MKDLRREIIKMAKRRAKPGAGSDLRVLKEESGKYSAGALVPDLSWLDFVIVGGLATARYMPQRMTLDTDILVRRDDLVDVESRLSEVHCSKTGQLSIGGSTWKMPGGRTLDVIALDETWVDDAISGAVRGRGGLPYIALEYLVLMKLESGRVQDLADISRMLGQAEEDALRRTRKVIRSRRPVDVEDLESLIMLGKREMKGSKDE